MFGEAHNFPLALCVRYTTTHRVHPSLTVAVHLQTRDVHVPTSGRVAEVVYWKWSMRLEPQYRGTIKRLFCGSSRLQSRATDPGPIGRA